MDRKAYIYPILADNPKDAIAAVKQHKQLYIAYQNWGVGSILPKVEVKLGYTKEGLVLLFKVEEYESLARYCDTNDPVYKDSCVEFFFTTQNDKNYYNFEFNAIGALLSQTGSSREDRIFATASELSTIYRSCNYTLNKTMHNNAVLFIAQWELGVFLPKELLTKRNVNLQAGNQIFANFYKCGDELKDPHYLSWNPVMSETPNFHLPDFFATLEFV